MRHRRPTSPSRTRSLAVSRRVHPRWSQRSLQPRDSRLDQGILSLRLGHWRTSWAKRYGGSHRGPMPFSLDDTTNGRNWWIKIVIRRLLWRWPIWTRRCRRSASCYRPTLLGSSRRAPRIGQPTPLPVEGGWHGFVWHGRGAAVGYPGVTHGRRSALRSAGGPDGSPAVLNVWDARTPGPWLQDSDGQTAGPRESRAEHLPSTEERGGGRRRWSHLPRGPGMGRPVGQRGVNEDGKGGRPARGHPGQGAPRGGKRLGRVASPSPSISPVRPSSPVAPRHVTFASPGVTATWPIPARCSCRRGR